MHATQKQPTSAQKQKNTPTNAIIGTGDTTYRFGVGSKIFEITKEAGLEGGEGWSNLFAWQRVTCYGPYIRGPHRRR